MLSSDHHRRSIIFVCGTITGLVTLFSPPNANADAPPCVEPFVEHCLMDAENWKLSQP